MTGSRAQWYNGMALLGMFFCCRLVWGTWQSVVVYMDMWKALHQTWTAKASPLLEPTNISAHVFYPTRDGAMCIDETCARANAEISRFKDYTANGVPTWLVLTYVGSNLILNFLNYYWFSKMVETVLKRFRTPENEGEKSPEKLEEIAQKVVLEAAAKLEEDESALRRGELPLSPEQIASGIDVGTLGDELRKRRAELVAKVPLPGA